MEKEIREQVITLSEELIENAKPEADELFILGCSSSEVIGEKIGSHGSAEVGEWIISSLQDVLKKHKLNFAVQCCEHLNRGIVVEKAFAKQNNLTICNVVPIAHAGGSAATAAYKLFDNPVVVEHITADLGMDIGDTEIGMHVRHVQVPVRLSSKKVGQAHTTFLKNRYKLIGGARAQYNTSTK
ncbi:MAG: TIGR01440 family protein [Erysipelotrichales bacterium]